MLGHKPLLMFHILLARQVGVELGITHGRELVHALALDALNLKPCEFVLFVDCSDTGAICLSCLACSNKLF